MKINGLDKIVAKFNDIDEKQRYYIFIGLLVLVFLLDYFVLMRPQLKTLTKINPEIKVLTGDLNKAKDDIKKLATYESQLEDIQKDLINISLRISSKNEVPLILERISLIADKSGVKIDQIMPESDELELLLENNNKKFYLLPVLIEAYSAYHSFGRFVNNVENSDIYLKVGSFTINSQNDSRRLKVSMILMAVIYEDLDGKI